VCERNALLVSAVHCSVAARRPLWAGVVVLAVALLLLAAAVLAGAVAPAASAAPDAAQLDAFLAAHQSPMTGMGAAFIAQGQANGVDPAFLVAISGAETNFGQLLYQKDGDIATFNAFNWFFGPTWPESDFASWDEAIAREAAGLAGSLYYGSGLYAVQDIAPRYCPDGTGNWITNVSSFLTQLGGDPADTRLTASYGPPVTQPGLLTLEGDVQVTQRHYKVGDMARAQFTVTNGGGSTLQLDGIALSARGSGGSAVDLVSRAPISLEPGASRVIVARWPLDQAGDWSGWIQVEQQGVVSLVGNTKAFGFTVHLPKKLELRRWSLREQGLHLR
jgi:hypothetical protein